MAWLVTTTRGWLVSAVWVADVISRLGQTINTRETTETIEHERLKTKSLYQKWTCEHTHKELLDTNKKTHPIG